MAQGFLSNLRAGASSATGPIGAGSFDENIPEWQGVPLDTGTQSLIDRQYQQAQQTNQQLADRQMAGVDKSLAPSSFSASTQYASGLGGGSDPAVTQALHDQAQRAYSQDISSLQRKALAEAPRQRAGLQNTSNQSLLGYQQLNNQINQQQWQSDMNKAMIRNKVIGNLFGAGGMAAGLYLGGKVKGAGEISSYGANANANAQKQPYESDPSFVGAHQQNWTPSNGVNMNTYNYDGPTDPNGRQFYYQQQDYPYYGSGVTYG